MKTKSRRDSFRDPWVRPVITALLYRWGAILAGAVVWSKTAQSALPIPGPVVAWGWNPYGQTTVPRGLTKFAAAAAGVTHTVALGMRAGFG
jgi:hypothetical protein